MRVVTWNIHHGSPGGGRPVDLGRVAAVLADLGAEVVGLQEVDRGSWRSWGVDQAAALAGACGARHEFGAARRLPWGGAYGNALLVRGAVGASGVHPLPTRGEPRCLLVARVVAGFEVTVGVTHLQHRGGAPTPEARSQLRAALDLLAARPGPSVLVGDLNLDGDDVLHELAAAGWSDVGSPATYPASRPTRRLDRVVVQGLRARSVEVPDVTVSDHRPVVVDLEVDDVAVVGSDRSSGTGHAPT